MRTPTNTVVARTGSRRLGRDALIAGLGVLLSAAAPVSPKAEPQEIVLLARISDGLTQAPVAGAVARLAGTRGASAGSQQLSNLDGRVLFRRLAPGSYRLSVSANGYIEGGFGTRGPTDRIELVDLTSKPFQELSVKLWRSASIRGTVVDSVGSPLVDAVVRTVGLAANLTEAAVKTATTDDKGEYAISDLRPGAYLVSVPSFSITFRPPVRSERDRDTSALAARGNQLSGPGIAFDGLLVGVTSDRSVGSPAVAGIANNKMMVRPTVYYPGSTRITEAERLVLRTGERRSGVDFTVPISPSVKLSGRVVGDSVANVRTIRLVQSTSTAEEVTLRTDTARGEVAPNGEFALLGVPPGDYLLLAASGAEGMFRDTSTGAPSISWAEMPIQVGAIDIPDVSVSLNPGVTLRGLLKLDQAPSSNSSARTVVDFRLRTEVRSTDYPGISLSGVDSTVGPSGEFRLGPLLPGTYSIGVVAPNGWLVSAIQSGNAVFGEQLVINRDTSATITATNRVGRIQGVISGSDIPSKASVRVMIVPKDYRTMPEVDRKASNRFRQVAVMSTGRFSIDNVLAGDYFIMAVEGSLSATWPSAADLALFATQGTTATVAAGISQEVTLRVSLGR